MWGGYSPHILEREMKPFMLLLCLLCAANVMAERIDALTPSSLVADVTTVAQQQMQPADTVCQPEQSFSPLKTADFTAIAGYSTDNSFPSDGRQSWQPDIADAFSCHEREHDLTWQAPGIPNQDAMRLLPSYPSSNNPSAYSSGWRRYNTE